MRALRGCWGLAEGRWAQVGQLHAPAMVLARGHGLGDPWLQLLTSQCCISHFQTLLAIQFCTLERQFSKRSDEMDAQAGPVL